MILANLSLNYYKFEYWGCRLAMETHAHDRWTLVVKEKIIFAWESIIYAALVAVLLVDILQDSRSMVK